MALKASFNSSLHLFSAVLALTAIPFWTATTMAESHLPKSYKGKPFTDSHYKVGAQVIPGKVDCAAYDVGGEGVAYHDTEARNLGSGTLNPADGSYLNEFRMHEGVDTSYTKMKNPNVQIDDSPYDIVQPPADQLYVGWTVPGEWFNLTVNVKQAGRYTVDLLYTSNRGGTISIDVNGKQAGGGGMETTEPLTIPSTFDQKDPIPWRQWHHWNLLHNLVQLNLPEGKSVLTVHILTEGQMNLAYFDFKPAKGRVLLVDAKKK